MQSSWTFPTGPQTSWRCDVSPRCTPRVPTGVTPRRTPGCSCPTHGCGCTGCRTSTRRSPTKRYTRTFHFVGQSSYEIGDDEATGEVYCLAHHLTPDRNGGTSYVMHMRYLDTYRRDGGGSWKFADRTAYVDWTETRSADLPGR
jgi:hypothetical protein